MAPKADITVSAGITREPDTLADLEVVDDTDDGVAVIDDADVEEIPDGMVMIQWQGPDDLRVPLLGSLLVLPAGDPTPVTDDQYRTLRHMRGLSLLWARESLVRVV